MLFLAGCVVIVGVILQATPFSLPQLIVARIVTGMLAQGTIPKPQPLIAKSPSRSRCRSVYGYSTHVCV